MIFMIQFATPQERQDSYSQLEADPSIINVLSKEFERMKVSGTPMAMYWMSFLEMVETLMRNLHALWTEDWDEFTTSLRLMLP